MAKQASIPKAEIKKSAILIALIVGIIAVSSLLLLTHYWFVWPAILISMLIVVGVFSASKQFYQCPSCDKEFKITALQDFFAPHGLTKGSNGELLEWKLLKCPHCDKREKCYRSAQPKNDEHKNA